jgi:nucleotide-binding universal stress UspA family protein
MHFKKILFATDFSDVSRHARTLVAGLREAGLEEVVLVHVIDVRRIEVMEEPSGWVAPSGGFERDVEERMHSIGQKNIKELQVQLEKAGFTVRPLLIDGIPWREIVTIADDENVDLIVVGSHGRSDIMQMLLGSVSENVIRHARQPVLVVRREWEPHDE